MPAEVEEQRVAMMSGPDRGSWMEHRAVCWDHGTDESGLIANWQGEETHKLWFSAKIDAAAHNHEFHPRRVLSWEEILQPREPDVS